MDIKRDRKMRMPIFWILFYDNPKALADLDNYQRRRHRRRMKKPAEPRQPLVTVDGIIEETEEISKLMSQAPSRSRGEDSDDKL